MPIWLQYIDFGIGVIGLIITVFTLKVAYSVKKQIINKAELLDFRESVDNIMQMIDGYVGSINDDQLYNLDNGQTLKLKIAQFITDTETRFSFLPKHIKKTLRKISVLLNKQNMHDTDWTKIANQLIKLKNSLRKERAYYG